MQNATDTLILIITIMNVFNNIKFTNNHPQIRKMEVYKDSKRISIGLSMTNSLGVRILESYPSRLSNGNIVYLTTKWANNDIHKKVLTGTQLRKLLEELTEPVV